MGMRICTRNHSARIHFSSPHPAIEIPGALTARPRFRVAPDFDPWSHVLDPLSGDSRSICLLLKALQTDRPRLLFKGRPGPHSPQLCQGTFIERYQSRTLRSEILMGLIESGQREAV
jgi:hypothetical protein